MAYTKNPNSIVWSGKDIEISSDDFNLTTKMRMVYFLLKDIEKLEKNE